MITPSTDLKFDPGLKGKNKLNYLRNYWLLIGKSAFLLGLGCSVLPPGGQRPGLISYRGQLGLVLPQVQDSLSDLGTFFTPKEDKQGSCVTKSALKNHLMFQNPVTD